MLISASLRAAHLCLPRAATESEGLWRSGIDEARAPALLIALVKYVFSEWRDFEVASSQLGSPPDPWSSHSLREGFRLESRPAGEECSLVCRGGAQSPVGSAAENREGITGSQRTGRVTRMTLRPSPNAETPAAQGRRGPQDFPSESLRPARAAIPSGRVGVLATERVSYRSPGAQRRLPSLPLPPPTATEALGQLAPALAAEATGRAGPNARARAT